MVVRVNKSMSMKKEGGFAARDDDLASLLEPVGAFRPPRRTRKPVEQYEHWLALMIGDDGKIQIRSSTSLKSHKEDILAEAFTKLRDAFPVPGKGGSAEAEETAAVSWEPRQNLVPHPGNEFSSVTAPFPFQRPAKRHRTSTMAGATPVDTMNNPQQQIERPRSEPRQQKLVAIEVGNHAAMYKWFSEAFRAVQQVACRTIAKAWIKRIHPRKQSTHPYNGSMPREQKADSDRTRPPYWPHDERHREPDHVSRQERIKLLVHILMNTPQPKIMQNPASEPPEFITAADLLTCLEEKRQDVKADKFEIYEAIIKARTAMERYEDGEIDASYTLWLIDYSDSSKTARSESNAARGSENSHNAEATNSSGGEVKDEDSEEDETRPPTPISADTRSPKRRARSSVMHSNRLPVRQGFEHDMHTNAVQVSRPTSQSLVSQMGSSHGDSNTMTDNIAGLHNFPNHHGDSILGYNSEALTMSPHNDHASGILDIADYIPMQNIYLQPAQFEHGESMFMHAPNMMAGPQHPGFFQGTQPNTPATQFHGLTYANANFQDQYLLGSQMTLPHRPNPNDGHDVISPKQNEMDGINNSFF